MKNLKNFENFNKSEDDLYTVTILTEESLDNHKDKKGIELENHAGYHFGPMSKEKAKEKKEKYDNMKKYKNENIVDVKIYPASGGMGKF